MATNWLTDHLPGPGSKRPVPTVRPDATAARRGPTRQQLASLLPVNTIGPSADPQGPPSLKDLASQDSLANEIAMRKRASEGLNTHPLVKLLSDAATGQGGFSPSTPAGLLLALGMGPEREGAELGARMLEHEIPKAGEKFAVLTAENAGGKTMDAAENLARNQKLVDRLKALGHDPVPVKGAYFDDNEGRQLYENSFYVPGMEPGQAMRLGKEFGQNSVVTNEGFHDMAKGKFYPSNGIVDPGEGTTYTQMPNGQKFLLDVDWAKDQPLVKPQPTPIRVRDRAPSVLNLLDGRAPVNPIGPNGVGAQRDLPRYVGPRTNPQALADIQQEAYKTYTGPEFEKLTREGNFPDWYLNPRTQQRAIDALGDTQGPLDFNRLMNMMGATTARSDPKNNLRRASYYRALEMAGLLDPEALLSAGYKDVPEGMGHLANNAHHKALAGLLQEGFINPFTNPKPASFVEDLTGNFRPYTNDTRMATGAAMINPRLLDMKAIIKSVDPKGGVTYSPRDWAYAPMEKAAQQAAHEYASRGLLSVPEGADPTAFWQAKVWDALGGILPKASRSQGTFDDVFDSMLSRNAKLWGTSETGANDLFWHGHPLDLPLGTDVVPGGLLDRF